MSSWANRHDSLTSTLVGILCVAILFGLVMALLFGLKSYSRYQKRQDANNQVAVTKILVEKAQQQARVNYAQIEATKAEAEKKYQESVGIRRAQDEIQKTLTPLYIQHEAVQAQLAMAHSENHTLIWAPSGTNGAPLMFPQTP